MSSKRPAIFYFRVFMMVAALLLPLLSLTLLGSLWLWQHGYVLYWAIAACSVTLLTYAIERWILRADLPEIAAATASRDSMQDEPDVGWSVRETAAWTAIVALSNDVRPLEITSRDEVFDLGIRAIETVARSMHPEEDHALWKFTLPEAFALIERVSTQLSAFVSDNIPLGDRMTVGQFLRVYRWRSAIGVAEQAYDLWRIIRLINPAAAATQEVREQLTRRAYDWGREELAKRLAQAYVREIGRAAIDLYSGRMRLAKGGGLHAVVTQATLEDRERAAQRVAEPVRILVAGQTGSGKSSLINELLGNVRAPVDSVLTSREYPAYVYKLEDGSEALLIDSPGISDTDDWLDVFSFEIDQSDLILWVLSAVRPDRDLAKRALDHIRQKSALNIARRPQPIVCVLTHIDALRPVHEWNPPYDLSNTANAKVRSIIDAKAISAVELTFAPGDIVAVSLKPGSLYNVATVQKRLRDLLPEAHRVKLLRIIDTAKPKMKWGRILSQAVNAGRVLLGK